MKISNEIEMLEIPAQVMGARTTIYPVLLHDDNVAILVDSGYPGQIQLMLESLERTAVPLNKLRKIIVTHQDIDHIGTLSAIVKELSEKIEIICHVEEKPFIQGEKSPIKLAGLEAKYDTLTDDMKAFYPKFKAAFESCFVQIDKTVNDEDYLPYCGGIRIIYTPGHTPGHISLYLEKDKVLIAGDLLAVENRLLVKAPLFTEFNPDLTLQSLKKLSAYDIDKVICYHGGVYNDNVNLRIAELANS